MNKCCDCGDEIEKYEEDISSSIRCDGCKEKKLSENLKNKIKEVQSEIDRLKQKKEDLENKFTECNKGIYEKEGILQ
ncbi:MAG: hypothetical protein KKG75_04325 [Nanoarchaeota archaeon]|nr:hypothetical protein [Nanoarchaeota archaeon]